MRCPSGRTESSAPTTGQRAVRNGTSYPKGICSAALHCGTPSPTSGSPYPSVGRDPCVPPHDMHVFLPAGHAGPALQGTGRARADRVVRPYDGSKSRAKRDVVPQGHLFRCAPLRDAVPYGRFSAPVRRAGPMCPAARYACFPSGGARGPRPTGHRPYPGGQSRPPLRRRTVCTSSRRNKVPACETRFYFVGRMRFNISISPSRYVLAARLRS